MNAELKAIHDRKRKAYQEWKAVMDTAKAAGDRPLTADEAKRADALEAEIDQCNDEIDGHRTGGSYGTREARLAAVGKEIERDAKPPRGYLQGPRSQGSPDRPDSSFAYRNERTGSWIRSAGQGEPLLRHVDGHAGPGELGECVRGMALGRFSSPRTAAAVREASDAQGGFIVPTHLASRIIDNARNRMVMTRAGMRTIPFPDTGNELALGRVESDPTCYWRTEGSAITASNPTFGKIFLRPKVLGCLVPTSIEFLEDVANAEALLENVIEKALAVELDRAILRGDGGGAELVGVKNTDDVQTKSIGGAWNFDDLVDAMELIWDENGPMPSAFIVSPATEGKRRRSKDGEGRYLFTQETPVSDIPFLVTNQCPSTEIYLGDFTRVLLAMKTDLKIEVLPAGTGSDSDGTSYNATSQMYRWIRCYLRADCHIEQPKHLVYCSGVTNA